MSVRQVGVEEELLLIDPTSGDAVAVSDRALRAAPDNGAVVEQELFLQQLETGTGVHRHLSELEQDIRRGRRVAGEAAQAVGAAVVAVSTAVLELQRPALTPKDRYGRMMDRFGAVVTDLRCRTAESWAGT